MKFITRETSGQIHLIDFTTPIPTVSIPMAGYGTTASIDYEDVNVMTDINNNVLFTSVVYGNDLIEVRDANYAIMPNGSGLLGNNSSQESGLVRIPCSANKYYFIHSTIAPSTIYYSIVDMSLNGGLGDVIQKNTLLRTNIGEGKTISHQLPTGCRWLIVPGFVNNSSYELVRFLISDAGIGSPVVIASINLTPTLNGLPFEVELSPDNSRISMSTHRDNAADPDIILWNFDLLSGTVSNRMDYSVSTDQIHGTEWSPDNTKVYFVGNTPNDNSDFGRINLTTGTIDIIDPMMGRYIGVIEKAGNGKIYVCPNYNHDYLAEVANPNDNNIANIGYNHNAVFISANGLRSNLPSAIEGEPPGTTITPQFIWFDASATGNCNEFAFRDSSCLGTWWEWNFGDGSFSNNEFPIHQYSTSDTFDITLRMVACGDTLVLTKPDYVISFLSNAQASFQSAMQFCNGDSVSFVNSSLNAGNFLWNFGDGITDTAFNTSHIYADSGNYVVTLIAYSPVGCPDTVSHMVTIMPIPVSNFTATIDTCNMTATFQNNSQLATAYAWDFGDQSSDNQENPVHQYLNGGNYTVVLVASNSIGCNDSSIFNFNLAPLPVAVFSSVINNCDSVAHFTGNSINTNTQIWNFGDGNSDTAANPVYIFHASGNFMITLIAYNSNGCSDTLVQPITVFQNPGSNFSVSIDTCSYNVSFINSSQLADGYTWDFGDQQFSNQANPVHHYSADGNFQATLISANAGVCYDTMQYNFILPALPVANFTFQIPDCDSLVYFTNQSMNAGNVSWNISDGSSYAIDNPVHQFPGFGQYDVTLIASSPNTSCTSQVIQTLNIYPDPIAIFNAALDTCTMQVSITNTSTYATNYQWLYSDGSTDTAFQSAHVFETSGLSSVQLIATNSSGCTDSLSILLNIPPLPRSDFLWTNIQCDSTVSFIQHSINTSNYFWSLGDGENSSDPNPVHIYHEAGNIPVQLISESQYGCLDTILKDLNIVIETPADFQVYIDSCEGKAIFLNQSPLAVTYDWNFDDVAASTADNPSFSFPSNNSYMITLTVNKGTLCAESMQVQIEYYVSEGEHVYLPNCFTPNDDGLNDIFLVENRVPCDNYSIDIFNRWGEMIFHSDDALSEFWNGKYKNKMSEDGVYVYILKGSHSRITGHIALIR
ncbi:MAG: PKD domain-containing protein [Bacteroidota bacterium]